MCGFQIRNYYRAYIDSNIIIIIIILTKLENENLAIAVDYITRANYIHFSLRLLVGRSITTSFDSLFNYLLSIDVVSKV